MDPRDIALQSLVPTVMVPKFSPLEPMQRAGHRFLVTGSGIWLEVLRDWLHLCLPLAEQTVVAMPYGDLEPKMNFTFGGKLPSHLVRAFVAEARARMPNECAGWIVWNRVEDSMRLQMLENIDVGKMHAKVHRPKLSDDEQLVIDIHSHGGLHAFYSPEDDRDDAGEVKISLVVGNCNKDQVTIKARLGALGVYLDLPAPELEQSMEEVAYG